MPIYEYRCSSCGIEKEYLQKLSDAPVTDCPGCGKSTMVKLLSAAGFQLKGTGWYATDFKQGSKPKPGAEAGKSEPAQTGGAAKADQSSGSGGAEAAPACGAGACPACQ